MYQEYARLVVYRGFPADSIFRQLCSIIREFDEGSASKYELIDRIHAQIKALLDLSTECGFDGNLWHCYLAWLLMTHENSFSLVCEKPSRKPAESRLLLADHPLSRRRQERAHVQPRRQRDGAADGG